MSHSGGTLEAAIASASAVVLLRSAADADQAAGILIVFQIDDPLIAQLMKAIEEDGAEDDLTPLPGDWREA